MPHSSAVIPCLRYADPKAAIRFLTEAFGFVEKLVIPSPDGGVIHAELTYGAGETRGMVMVGGAERKFFDMHLPAEVRGVTDCLYVVVADTDAHCAKARAAGAEILEGPLDREYGSREYVARDPGGYLWDFGTYDPWKG
ncbi:VOC family protein [Neoroseomonas alba]|uniref:VOC family protein n=1 Tax=Roseomonas alba TaxID=2846776 RepID=UPI001CA57849|nr:VOC family protein [Neoroseomonas alba]